MLAKQRFGGVAGVPPRSGVAAYVLRKSVLNAFFLGHSRVGGIPPQHDHLFFGFGFIILIFGIIDDAPFRRIQNEASFVDFG